VGETNADVAPRSGDSVIANSDQRRKLTVSAVGHIRRMRTDEETINYAVAARRLCDTG